MNNTSRLVLDRVKHPLFIRAFHFLIAALVLVSLYSLLSAVFAPWYRIDVKLSSDHQDIIKIYHWNGLRGVQFREKFSYTSKSFAPNKIQTISIKHSPHSLKAIRLDPGTHPGVTRIYSITLYNSLIGMKKYTAKEIYKNFYPNDQISQYELRSDHVLIQTMEEDPSLTANLNLPPMYQGFIAFLSLLFSGILFLFLGKPLIDPSRKFLTSFPAFNDIKSKKSAEGVNTPALDGLRGVGALYVLAEHATRRFDGLGGLGVCLFFSLSGYLLIIPFLKDSTRIFSKSYMIGFVLRRMRRILPIYGSYLFVVYFLNFHFNTFFRHIFFLQGDKHLWAMPQEMLFYLIIPGILCLFHMTKKISPWAAVALFTVLTGLVHFSGYQVNIIHNSSYHMDIMGNLGIFFGGMLAALLYNEMVIRKAYVPSQKTKSFFGLCGLGIFLGFSLLSTGVFGTKIHALSFPFYYDFLAAGLIFCIMLSPGSLLNRFLSSTILRAVGLVSFSFYIVHFLILKLIKSFADYYYGIIPDEILLMILAGIVTYLVSIITYSYIERPFIHYPIAKEPKV